MSVACCSRGVGRRGGGAAVLAGAAVHLLLRAQHRAHAARLSTGPADGRRGAVHSRVLGGVRAAPGAGEGQASVRAELLGTGGPAERAALVAGPAAAGGCVPRDAVPQDVAAVQVPCDVQERPARCGGVSS